MLRSVMTRVQRLEQRAAGDDLLLLTSKGIQWRGQVYKTASDLPINLETYGGLIVRVMDWGKSRSCHSCKETWFPHELTGGTCPGCGGQLPEPGMS